MTEMTKTNPKQFLFGSLYAWCKVYRCLCTWKCSAHHPLILQFRWWRWWHWWWWWWWWQLWWWWWRRRWWWWQSDNDDDDMMIMLITIMMKKIKDDLSLHSLRLLLLSPPHASAWWRKDWNKNQKISKQNLLDAKNQRILTTKFWKIIYNQNFRDWRIWKA